MGQERVKKYLEAVLDEYVFDELSEEFLGKLGAADIMRGVPMPVKASDFKDGRITPLDITRSVAVALGASYDFPYDEQYKKFLELIFKENAEAVTVNEGKSFFGNGDDMTAACLFRAALKMDPDSLDGMYSYALCCREIYMAAGDDGEMLGKFKAEAIENFERLSIVHPDFAFTYYYLGYAYLNMGMYKKADITWRDFLTKIQDDPAADEVKEEIKEIKERRASLEGPMEIEEGVLAVTSGRYDEGIAILSKYELGELASWWPMHYYLGVAYECTGKPEKAVAALKRALNYSPSNLDVMEELVAIYGALGDKENETKYAQKILVVKKNIADEAKTNSEAESVKN